MKYLQYLLIGVFFGIIMTKSEAISWYRIQEMFRFHSFHMYGIIGSTVALLLLFTGAVRRFNLKTLYGNPIQFQDKARSVSRYLLGGIIFGLGWALTGACPGPIFVLLGNGYFVLLIVLASAVLGTFTYGAIKDRLPH